MKQVFKRPESLVDRPFHFCPGCHHGIIHRLVAETIDRYGLREQCIGVASVGCSVFLYDYFDVDVLEAPHGRAAAVATGVKRSRPDCFVFTYQGDGDLAAIGTAEILHAANRGERLTVVFVNNTTYGMTGGQMAPTTLPGQTTTTSPYGRDPEVSGHPIKMAEIMAQLGGVGYAARVSVHNPKHLMKAKKAFAKAVECQLENKGLGFVEFLSACPTNWKMDPLAATRHVEEVMVPFFPLGEFKNEI